MAEALTLCLCTRMYQRHSVNTAVWRQRSTPCRGAPSKTQRTLDSGAKLWAYLDDLYIWIKPNLALGATRTINVELQPSKMQIWTASCASPVPPTFLSRAKRTLKCLRAHLHMAGDGEGSPVERGGRALHPARTLVAGFHMHTVNDLFTVYVGAASLDALRMTFVLEAEAISFDTEVVAYLSHLAGEDHMRFCGSCQPHVAVHPLRNPPCARKRRQAFGVFLDEWYIWICPQHVPAIDLASGATRTINFELQPSKIQIWTASYTSPVPPAFLSKAKRTLKCFGSPSPHGR